MIITYLVSAVFLDVEEVHTITLRVQGDSGEYAKEKVRRILEDSGKKLLSIDLVVLYVNLTHNEEPIDVPFKLT